MQFVGRIKLIFMSVRWLEPFSSRPLVSTDGLALRLGHSRVCWQDAQASKHVSRLGTQLWFPSGSLICLRAVEGNHHIIFLFFFPNGECLSSFMELFIDFRFVFLCSSDFYIYIIMVCGGLYPPRLVLVDPSLTLMGNNSALFNLRYATSSGLTSLVIYIQF